MGYFVNVVQTTTIQQHHKYQCAKYLLPHSPLLIFGMILQVHTCTGHAAPSPRAQIVCPSICLLSSQIMSISDGRASPFTKRHIMLFIQSTPTETDEREI